MRVMKKMCASVDDSEVRSFLVDDDARPKSLYYVRRIPTVPTARTLVLSIL